MSDKQLTAEELLAVIEQGSQKPKKKRRIENNVNTLRYIQETGVEPGLVAVPNYVIFHHYNTVWKGSDIKYKANKIVFFRTFNQHLKGLRKEKQRYYLIKEGIYDLSPENLEKAAFYDKKYVRLGESKRSLKRKAKAQKEAALAQMGESGDS